MPLFRRREHHAPSLQFTTGINRHRVAVGGSERGLAGLDELRGYVASVTGAAAAPGRDGRDSVAVLSAKMDFAEMVGDAVSLVVLAVEELVERGVLPAEALSAPPRPSRPGPGGGHYAYIQEAHRGAQARMEWLERADAVLREHTVAILPPAPTAGSSYTRLG